MSGIQNNPASFYPLKANRNGDQTVGFDFKTVPSQDETDRGSAKLQEQPVKVAAVAEPYIEEEVDEEEDEEDTTTTTSDIDSDSVEEGIDVLLGSDIDDIPEVPRKPKKHTSCKSSVF